MKPEIIFFLCIAVCISCKKDENNGNYELKTYNIIIRGVVSDQVTNQPVGGASVSCGVQPMCMPVGDNLYHVDKSTLSGTDGTYELVTTAVSAKDFPIGTQADCIALFASKQGFAGCDDPAVSYHNGQNSFLIIKLYHYYQLSLHIKNDTVNNNKDEAEFVIYKFPRNYISTGPKIVCKGRKLDTTYLINNLMGNWCSVCLAMAHTQLNLNLGTSWLEPFLL